MSQPLLIALCGMRHSGKSEVQRILSDQFDIQPMDDGDWIRNTVMDLFGLDEWHVQTQEGKSSLHVLPNGETESVRKSLGDLGQIVEDRFGDQVTPARAVRKALANWEWDKIATGREILGYSFGSVRKTQGRTYREHGGYVVEVTRPGIGTSGFGFDLYDKSVVTHTIANDGTIEDLEMRVREMFGPVVGKHLESERNN